MTRFNIHAPSWSDSSSIAGIRRRLIVGRPRLPFFVMPALVLMAVLIGLAGCQTSDPVALRMGEVPLDVVRQVPNRIELLKPGMNPKQVFDTLGLSGYPITGVGTGPPNRYACQLLLRPGYSIELIYDERQRPPALLSASLMDDGWKQTPPSP